MLRKNLTAFLFFFVGMSCQHLYADQGNKEYKSFQKPIFSYLGIEGSALDRLANWQVVTLEDKIRKQIEKGRFLFIKLPIRSVEEGRYVQKMVNIIRAKSLGIAKMRAAWDTEFQGYTVTADLLKSVQNNSFYYWIEVRTVRRVRSSGQTTWHMGARLHIRQLQVFYCTRDNRRLSRRHFRACRMRRGSDLAGFARPFRVVKAFVKGAGPNTSFGNLFSGRKRRRTRRTRFAKTANYLGKNLFNQLAKIREFSLHAPVMSASFNSVTTNIGKSEGLTLNRGFKVFVRRVGGKYKYKGYVRIREVGDNRFKMVNGQKVRVNPKAPFLSKARILSVSGGTTLQKGFLMFEHPTLGIALGASLGLAPLTVLNSASVDGGVPFPIFENTLLGMNVRINTEFDLSNQTNISEFYLNVAADLIIIPSSNYGLLLTILPAFGVLKKFYFRNIGLSLGARAILGYNYSEDSSVSGLMFGAEGIIGLDIFIVPEFTLTIRAAFRGAFSIAFDVLSVGPWFMLGGNYCF